MAWSDLITVDTTNLDAGTDSPASARADIKQIADNVNTIKGEFTTGDGAKLAGIESNATADQTDGEIKTAYETNANTNAFTDAEQTKLSGIATSANNYTHPSTDGSLHVPATSTINDGKVLTAGATAGSLSWQTPSAGGAGGETLVIKVDSSYYDNIATECINQIRVRLNQGHFDPSSYYSVDTTNNDIDLPAGSYLIETLTPVLANTQGETIPDFRETSTCTMRGEWGYDEMGTSGEGISQPVSLNTFTFASTTTMAFYRPDFTGYPGIVAYFKITHLA